MALGDEVEGAASLEVSRGDVAGVVPVEAVEGLEAAEAWRPWCGRRGFGVALAALEGDELLEGLRRARGGSWWRGRGARARASREARRPRARSISAMSSVGIVGLQVVGDDVAVGDMGAEVEVDGDGAVGGAAALLAEHGEGAGVVGAAGDGLARPRRRGGRRRRGRAGATALATMKPTLRPASTQRSKRMSKPGTAARSRSRPLALAGGALVLEQLARGARAPRCAGRVPSSARAARPPRCRRAGAPRVAGDERQRLVGIARRAPSSGWCRSARRRSCRRGRAARGRSRGADRAARAAAPCSSASTSATRARAIGVRADVGDVVEEDEELGVAALDDRGSCARRRSGRAGSGWRARRPLLLRFAHAAEPRLPRRAPGELEQLRVEAHGVAVALEDDDLGVVEEPLAGRRRGRGCTRARASAGASSRVRSRTSSAHIARE